MTSVIISMPIALKSFVGFMERPYFREGVVVLYRYVECLVQNFAFMVIFSHWRVGCVLSIRNATIQVSVYPLQCKLLPYKPVHNCYSANCYSANCYSATQYEIASHANGRFVALRENMNSTACVRVASYKTRGKG